jgi:hypothetical protein
MAGAAEYTVVNKTDDYEVREYKGGERRSLRLICSAACNQECHTHSWADIASFHNAHHDSYRPVGYNRGGWQRLHRGHDTGLREAVPVHQRYEAAVAVDGLACLGEDMCAFSVGG